MTTSEERLKILKMVEEKKITPEEAARLLAALARGERRRQAAGDLESRWLRVRVTDVHSGKPSVNVTIPMRLVNVGLKVGARFIPDVEGIELGELANALRQGMSGKVMDVVDEEEGQRVEIYVE
ncbi:MAG TPA: hypothetical protein VFI11_12150 [Anaerolineales bacterium]|nr:hypothetical protein [Anaerolineales bacterium]